MKEFHSEIVEETSTSHKLADRLNVMVSAGWTYISHVFIESEDMNKKGRIYRFSLLLGK